MVRREGVNMWPRAVLHVEVYFLLSSVGFPDGACWGFDILGLLNPLQSLVRFGQVHWRRRCSKCVKTWGACAVGGIVAIDRKFRQGRAWINFEGTWLDIFVGPLGLG